MSVFVIAEIGINHNGSLDIAKQLISEAAAAGCDAVKFQKRTIEKVYSKEELDKPRESPWGTTNREQKNGLEFTESDYEQIDAYCKEKNIEWFASAWDVDSQIFMRRFNCKYNKVASAMLTHRELLEEIASEKKHTFISTGMSTYDDIQKAVDIFQKHDCPYSLLHCVSTYPCRDEDCNIIGMLHLRDKFKCDIGYSGHESGILPTVVAATLGAKIIERHITLDRAMYGSDQSASLEIVGLKRMMDYVRDIIACMGSPEKKVMDTEVSIAEKLRKVDTL